MNLNELESFQLLFKFPLVLIPLRENGKEPITDDWTTFPFENEYYDHAVFGGNVGVRLSASDLVIDFDIKNLGPGVNREAYVLDFLRQYGIEDALRVKTVSGGYHVYLKKDPNTKISKYVKDLWGTVVEFKSAGSQVVAPGSYVIDKKKGIEGPYIVDKAGSPNILCPAAIMDKIRKNEGKGKASGQTVVSDKYLAQLLDCLNPVDFSDNDSWLEVALSAHSASSGSAVELFVAWSRRDPKYNTDENEGLVRARWASFSSSGSTNVFKLHQLIKASGKPVPRLPAADAFADLDLSDIPEYIESPKPPLGTLRNFRYEVTQEEKVDKRKKDAEPEVIEKVIKVPLQLNEILPLWADAFRYQQPFIYQGNLSIVAGDQESVISVPAKFFICTLAKAGVKYEWNSGNGFVSEAAFGVFLSSELRQVSRVQKTVSWPQREGTEYIGEAASMKDKRSSDLSALEGFLDFFKFHSDLDRYYAKAYLLSLFWDVDGEKPIFLITSTGETAMAKSSTGKSELAYQFNNVATASRSVPKISFSSKGKSVTQQIGDILFKSPETVQIIGDNLRARDIVGPDIEALVTSSTIQAHVTHVGGCTFRNNFVHVYTTNEPNLTPDFMTRAFEIRLDPHKGRDIGWSKRIRDYVSAHREQIIASCLFLLEQAPVYAKTSELGRFPLFEDQVLTKAIPQEIWRRTGDQIYEETLDRRKQGDSNISFFAGFDERLLHILENDQGIDMSKYKTIVVKRVFISAIMKDHIGTSVGVHSMIKEAPLYSDVIAHCLMVSNKILKRENVVVLRGHGERGTLFMKSPKDRLSARATTLEVDWKFDY